MRVTFVLLCITFSSTRQNVESARTKLQLAPQNFVQVGEPEAMPVDHPAICADSVIEETCLLLNKGGDPANLTTDEAISSWETHAKVWVPWSQIQRIVAADTVSMQQVWTALHMPDSHWHPDLVMKCSEICSGIMQTLRADGYGLPPSSDVGCYGAGSARRCDLDLSLQAMKPLLDSGDLPDLHDKELMHDKHEAAQEAAAAAAGSEEVILTKQEAPEISYSIPQLMRRLANMFRVWPDEAVSFTDVAAETAASSFTEELSSETECRPGMIPHSSGIGCICDSANGYTTFSYEAKTCVQKPQSPSSPCQHEGMIPHPSGEGCTCDSANGYSWSNSTKGCAKGLLPQEPPPPAYEPPPPAYEHRPSKVPSNWRVEVQKRALQAQAYINTAMQEVQSGSRHVKDLQTRWFGNANIATNKEASRILNSVSRMMGNVEYRYPGDDCEGYPGTYAYVFPDGEDSMNSKGQYIFFLCDGYFAEGIAKQNEILVHEASHHATAYCNDLCVEEGQEIVYETHLLKIRSATKNTPIIYKESKEYLSKVTKNTYPNPHPGDSFVMKANQVVKFRSPLSPQKALPARWDNVRVTIEKVFADSVYVRIDPEDYECTDIAYGRKDCERLAEISSHKALRNADNFCYFVQDVTDMMYDRAF